MPRVVEMKAPICARLDVEVPIVLAGMGGTSKRSAAEVRGDPVAVGDAALEMARAIAG